MTTKTKTAARSRPQASVAELRKWLADNELRLYLKEIPVSTAIREFMLATNTAVPLDEFQRVAGDHCRVWCRNRKMPVSKQVALSDGQWDRLKDAVAELRDLLHGLSLDEAVTVVRSRVSCNASQLKGLTSRLRVWEQGAE